MALTDKLSAIGEAIREKTGKEDLLSLDEMPTEIRAIETSSGDDKYLQLIDRSISGEIVIPEGVTTIYTGMFCECVNVTNISIPNSVVSIESEAFRNCPLLNELIIPENVTTLGQHILRGNSADTLRIKSKDLSIPSYAFRFSEGTSTVIIENGTKSIGSQAFCLTNSITTLYLANSIVSIDNTAFYNCGRIEFVTLEQGFAASLNISYSLLYSVETLVAMFEAYADLTGQATATLTIGPVNIAKLTEEQIAILTEKNVTLA